MAAPYMKLTCGLSAETKIRPEKGAVEWRRAFGSPQIRQARD